MLGYSKWATVSFKKIPNLISYFLEIDSSFLALHNLCDYSLLVGIKPKNVLLPPRHTKAWRSRRRIASEQETEYYFGIIDFLTEYDFKRWTEHTFKSIYEDGKKISIIPPKEYRDRFSSFLKEQIKVELD